MEVLKSKEKDAEVLRKKQRDYEKEQEQKQTEPDLKRLRRLERIQNWPE